MASSRPNTVTRTARALVLLTLALSLGSLASLGAKSEPAYWARPGHAAPGMPALAASATPAATSTVIASATASFPTTAEVDTAVAWAKRRKGVVAFAVARTDGRIRGLHVNEQFVTASVVKAMLLVSYLRTHGTLSSSAKSELTSMIHVSDTAAATAIYRTVGDKGLRRLAKAADMKHFSVSVSWGRAKLTPCDQALFFLHMDPLVPRAHRAFARQLLSHIVGYESWGIPEIARPAGWAVFFKGGWRTTTRGQLVHQIARLERKGEPSIAIAVMTDGDPDMDYGIGTIRGITKQLLGLSK
jgi:hypothetical protein